MAQAVNVLHKDSSGCGKSELELFTEPPTQIEMNKGFWESVDPVASVQTSDTTEFLCAANPDVYTDLANSYLHVKAKITKANGADLNADEQVFRTRHCLLVQTSCFRMKEMASRVTSTLHIVRV